MEQVGVVSVAEPGCLTRPLRAALLMVDGLPPLGQPSNPATMNMTDHAQMV